ncbi:transposase [Paracoccus sp. Z330]|uniref:Transposase n=2 Tax=Paracoccus onchidii TaxID=3017813 RepID=A0ABT4ZK15_9RHOB|nr:transposase [Paracoccus onchidii]MDB6179710.1 transposase [Paracoccus onchidii]
MAHVRRKFVDVLASQVNAIAEEEIRRIAMLYAVEKGAGCESPDARVALRQSRSSMIWKRGCICNCSKSQASRHWRRP